MPDWRLATVAWRLTGSRLSMESSNRFNCNQRTFPVVSIRNKRIFSSFSIGSKNTFRLVSIRDREVLEYLMARRVFGVVETVCILDQAPE